jgi:dienelactone hydrolase
MFHSNRLILTGFLVLCITTSGRAEVPSKTGPWDVTALQSTNVTPQWGEAVGKAREVYYEGEPFKGKTSRVFGYYGKPEGNGPFPAVVLVHDGNGKAFRDWAEHWAARGYCALAMDLAGNGPKRRLPDGGPGQSDIIKFQEFDDTTAKDMWTYHAVAAVIRGHNLLRSFPEVDKDRTAVTGISWGGYLTCIVAGLDHRFKAAVPVYGCGFLHENSFWKSKLDEFMPERRERWVKNFDPSRYLSEVRCPILFLNGTTDFAYPLDSCQKCYRLVTAPRTVSILVRMKHGHYWTFGEVDAFIDSHLKGGDPLPKVGEMTQLGDEVSAPASGKIKVAHLHYAVADGTWQKRKWTSVTAELRDGRVTARVPADRPLVYYLAVTDDQGLQVSDPHAELPYPQKNVKP